LVVGKLVGPVVRKRLRSGSKVDAGGLRGGFTPSLRVRRECKATTIPSAFFLKRPQPVEASGVLPTY